MLLTGNWLNIPVTLQFTPGNEGEREKGEVKEKERIEKKKKMLNVVIQG